MSNSPRRLAQRFRAGHERRQAVQEAERTRNHRTTAEAWEAVEALLDELEEFAETSGFLEVSRSEARLLLRYDGRKMRLTIDRNEPTVQVRGTNLSQTCHLEFHPMRRVWLVVNTDRYGRRTVADLYDRGLERMITTCFGVLPASPREIPAERTSKEGEEKNRSRFWR